MVNNSLQSAEAGAVVLDAKTQTENTMTPEQKTERILAELAGLSLIEYEKVRKQKAEALGVRESVLDQEVKQRRPKQPVVSSGNGIFENADPWDEPVNAVRLFDEIKNLFSEHLALPDHAAEVMTLWAAHTHVFECFDHTPRLNITALEKGCGKTQTLDVLSVVAARSVRAENLSVAVLFRLIDAHKLTTLVDEVDSYLRDNNELRGAINSGHKCGGVFLRCEGDNNEPRAYKVFAPMALAGIGELPGTIKDRSIIIRLKRAKKGEVTKRFESKFYRDQVLKRKLMRWADDNRETLASFVPNMPDGFYNRVADKWGPIFAIAQVVGGDWPKRIEKAATALSGEVDQADSIKVELLADVKAIFDKKRADVLGTMELIEALTEDDEAPWKEFNNGKPITPAKLAKLLRPFGAQPGTRRKPGAKSTAKGYARDEFKDSFTRYLTSEPSQPSQPCFSREIQENQGVTHLNCDGSKNAEIPFGINECDGVTAPNPDLADNGESEVCI